MKKTIFLIVKMFDGIERIFENLAALFLAGFAVTAMLQVLTRFVFKAPLPWSEEGARYLFIFMLFSGCIVGVRRVSHYSLDMFISKLNGNVRRILGVTSSILQLSFFCFLSYTSLIFIKQMNERLSPVMKLPMGVPYSAIVIFSLLGAAFTLEHLIRVISPGFFTADDARP